MDYMQLLAALKKAWQLIRELSGDDAYERYLHHQKLHHPDETPLSRQAFFQQEQHRKWHGVKRCC